MDNQILRPKCQICNVNTAMGLSPTKKWACGECLIKLDNKLKEERRKYYELIEDNL